MPKRTTWSASRRGARPAARGLCLAGLAWALAAPASGDPGQVGAPPASPSGSTARIGPEAVTIPTRSVPEERERVPAAVATIEGDDLRRARPEVGIDEPLGRIPGLVVQSRTNFAQDLRLSSRGFGARSSFGIRGLKVIVDGIPATLPDGQTQMDAIDPGAVDRIEILRGPASSLYGASAGGVIRIRSPEPPEAPFVEARGTLDGFGVARGQIRTGGRAGALSAAASVSRLDRDGHRDQSEARASLLHARFRYALDDTSELALVMHALDGPRAEDPGALTRDEVREDPDQASPRNLLFDAGEQVDEQALGLTWRKTIGSRHEVSARAYSLWRDFSNRLPFQNGGAVDLDRFFGGGGAQYAYDGELLGRPHRWTAGFDVDAQRDRRLRFDNVAGQRGTLRFDQDEDVTAAGVYLQSRWRLLPRLDLTAGARVDAVRFRVHDRFRTDGDESGSRRFEEFSPALGVLWRPRAALNLYGNVSTSFETPTTTEFANPTGGGLNPDLDAAHALGIELGAKGLVPGRVRYDVAIFRIRVDDELVPFEISGQSGRTFFRNAGRSTREGLEVGLALEPRPGLIATVAYTFSDFRFDRYATPDGVFDGNRLPGVPRHQAFFEVAYHARSGFYAAWEALYLAEIPADDANTAESAARWVSGVRVSQRVRFGRVEVEPFAGVSNLFDRDYADNVRINAFGGRFFEPAPGRSFFAGLRVRYDWGG